MDVGKIKIVDGDLLDQKTDAIVNPWNLNRIPWWLLLPSGVSGAIKNRAGTEPFKEVARFGPIPLGEVVVTTAGKLPYRCIIHVASINLFWKASEQSIRMSVKNAISAAEEHNVKSLAFPVLGAGAGGFKPDQAEKLMIETLKKIESKVEVTLVRYKH